MKLNELKEKFYYVQVKDQYDVIKAHDLLSKIGVTVFKDDGQIESFLKRQREKDKPVKNNFLIKDDDGWRIQSHFIATDHTTDELEEEIKNYLRSKEREGLSDIEKEAANKMVTDITNDLDAFACYLYHNYHNLEDVNNIKQKLDYFLNDIAETRYGEKFKSFKESDDFKSNLESFLREVKLNKLI